MSRWINTSEQDHSQHVYGSLRADARNGIRARYGFALLVFSGSGRWRYDSTGHEYSEAFRVCQRLHVTDILNFLAFRKFNLLVKFPLGQVGKKGEKGPYEYWGEGLCFRWRLITDIEVISQLTF